MSIGQTFDGDRVQIVVTEGTDAHAFDFRHGATVSWEMTGHEAGAGTVVQMRITGVMARRSKTIPEHEQGEIEWG